MAASSAPTMISAKVSKTPAAIHSSRRVRKVVSETVPPTKRSASTQEHPVTRRTNCQRPRQNPHRRPIELPTDGQRNSPGTATGIPQERTAMSSPSTT